jgi:hypothetical protein
MENNILTQIASCARGAGLQERNSDRAVAKAEEG